MVVDERSRHELYRRLEEVLGADAATTLIEHLPPSGWSDVATKHDLANLEQRMELRFDRLEERFDGRFALADERFSRVDDRITASASDLRASFEHELRAQTMTMMFGLVGVVLTMAALAFALARLA